MIRSTLMVAILVASSSALADAIPYVSSADVPDYVATMTFDRGWGKPRGPLPRTVFHHRGWVRIDDPYAVTYGNPAKHLSITIRPHPDASYASVFIERSARASYLGIRGSLETGKTETYAGELCQVREVFQGSEEKRKTDPHWITCLTPDGIEIGTRVVSGYDGSVKDRVKLVSLERRPVAAAEVTPPADLLDVSPWLRFDDQAAQGESVAIRRPDFAVHMHAEGAVRIVRGHGDWTYDERSYSDGRRYLAIWNGRTGQQLSFGTLEGGAFERLFMLQKYLPEERISLPYGLGLAGAPERTGRNASVLGQQCAWFDMTPNMADGSLHHCLTQDGIPLKIRSGGWASVEEFVADEIERRDVGIEDIRPPADVLLRSNWDIPG